MARLALRTGEARGNHPLRSSGNDPFLMLWGDFGDHQKSTATSRLKRRIRPSWPRHENGCQSSGLGLLTT